MKKLNHWESGDYYDKASCASKVDHPGMKLLHSLVSDGSVVVDLGCGEGTRLHLLVEHKMVRRAIGIDISKTAILRAKKKYKNFEFIKANLENLPLYDSFADLVYSAFVLEHTDNTKKVLGEAIRISRKGGDIVLIAPNYGAPNRSSPPYRGSRIGKLMIGFVNDIFYFGSKLKWLKTIPIMEKYDIDYDVTVEPYIKSLISFLRHKNIKVVFWDTCWSEELSGAKLHQKIFRLLASRGVYPFNYWGPHLIVHGVKM